MNLEDTIKVLQEDKGPITAQSFFDTLNSGTDVMFIDLNDIRDRVAAFRHAFNWLDDPKDIRFATKASKYGEVLQTVKKGGLGFEVASESEVEVVHDLLGIDGKDIVFSNPGKHFSTAVKALQSGVRLFVSDSTDDLDTLQAALTQVNQEHEAYKRIPDDTLLQDFFAVYQHGSLDGSAPKSYEKRLQTILAGIQERLFAQTLTGASEFTAEELVKAFRAQTQPIHPEEIQIVVRLQQAAVRRHAVDKCGSHLGLPVRDSEQLLDAERFAEVACNTHHFSVVGSTFNAGTNQLDIAHWQPFIQQAAEFAQMLKDKYGVARSILDMGGSYPALTSEKVEDLDIYAREIKAYIEQAFQDQAFPRVIIEPGRGIAHPAHLFGTVISVKPHLAKSGAFHAVTTIGHSNSGVRVSLANSDGSDTAGFRLSGYTITDAGHGQMRLETPAGGLVEYDLENLVTADVARYADGVKLPPLKKGDVIAVSGAGAYADSFTGNWLQLPNPRIVTYDSKNLHLEGGCVRDIGPGNAYTWKILRGVETAAHHHPGRDVRGFNLKSLLDAVVQFVDEGYGIPERSPHREQMRFLTFMGLQTSLKMYLQDMQSGHQSRRSEQVDPQELPDHQVRPAEVKNLVNPPETPPL